MSTEAITNADVISWYCTEWAREQAKFTLNPAQRTIELLMEVADDIASNPYDLIAIENKIVLSIAIRLKAEQYMIARINDDATTNAIRGNQTRKLYELIAFDRSLPEDMRIQDIIERVLIITSENIHINSFMYEPIVDMSLEELIRLYGDINAFLL
jgi:hypothetical protein